VYEESLQSRVTEDSCKIISDLYLMTAEVKWENNGNEPAQDYTFFYRKVYKNYQLCTGFFVHQRFKSAFKGTEFVSDNM